MPRRAAKRPSGRAPSAPRKPPGGKVRTRAEVLKLLDVCEEAILLGLPKYQMRTMLGRAAGLDGPLSSRTTDDYIARVRQRHLDNPLPELEEAREQAVRRCQRMITALIAQGNDGQGRVRNEAAILRWETRLHALRGLDAMRDKEAVEAAALAMITLMVERERQRKEQALTQQEQREVEHQRMIDVGEAPEGTKG
jgi:hypothetical protein